MDTLNTVEKTDSGCRLRSSRVIIGAITDEQERGIRLYGDLASFAEAIRAVVEGG